MNRLRFRPSPEIKGKFRVVNTVTPVISFGGTVDLRTITLKEAEYLVSNGFGYLEKIEDR